jgi:hypothetical protein
MSRTIAECRTCGQKITSEEVEIGMSLVCPQCEPLPKKEPKKKPSGSASVDEQK